MGSAISSKFKVYYFFNSVLFITEALKLEQTKLKLVLISVVTNQRTDKTKSWPDCYDLQVSSDLFFVFIRRRLAQAKKWLR